MRAVYCFHLVRVALCRAASVCPRERERERRMLEATIRAGGGAMTLGRCQTVAVCVKAIRHQQLDVNTRININTKKLPARDCKGTFSLVQQPRVFVVDDSLSTDVCQKETHAFVGFSVLGGVSRAWRRTPGASFLTYVRELRSLCLVTLSERLARFRGKPALSLSRENDRKGKIERDARKEREDAKGGASQAPTTRTSMYERTSRDR